MYYVNTSGKSFTIYWKEQEFFIHGWSQIDLPEEMREYIEERHPQLEVDYHKYVAEG